MRGFSGSLAVMLLAMPAAGFTQGTQPKTPPAVPATATAAPQTPASAAADTPQTSPAAPGTAPAVSPAPTAAPANPSSPGKTLAMVNPETYVIGADDSLQVTVWKEPTLSGTFPVRPDGKISLVLVGDLPAAGKTPTQLGDEITLRLKKYVQDPVVTVVVIAVNSQRVFLVGEVPHVGPIMLTPGMTPLQAIAAAGGPTMFASVKKIYILRGVGGKQQKIPFNYKQALKGDNKQDVSLEPGDTIVVP